MAGDKEKGLGNFIGIFDRAENVNLHPEDLRGVATYKESFQVDYIDANKPLIACCYCGHRLLYNITRMKHHVTCGRQPPPLNIGGSTEQRRVESQVKGCKNYPMK
ncbi:hypothetical protein R1flu_024641 [Riccia fluitans]|uniref:Uncharacterized protein n=1 Tax=Riccia fluitans TaxID=41844 RepID=A0ABD1XVH4_9MARC